MEEEDVAAAPQTSESDKVQLVPFDSLRGYVNYDTLKALTFKPFTLSAMSEVQRRVLKLMPYLAGGKLSSVARQSEEDGELVDNPDAVENPEGLKRGREDLLVKAKTGTGKTIVSDHLYPHIYTLPNPPRDPSDNRPFLFRPLTRERTSSTS